VLHELAELYELYEPYGSYETVVLSKRTFSLPFPPKIDPDFEDISIYLCVVICLLCAK